MIGSLFSGSGYIALEQGLKAAATRQQVISNNIANINTPGYKKQDVNFEDEFARAIEAKQHGQLATTDSRHMRGAASLSKVGIGVSSAGGMSMRYDGNNVDIDEEMAKLAENTLRFNTMATLIGSKFSGLKMVINGGR